MKWLRWIASGQSLYELFLIFVGCWIVQAYDVWGDSWFTARVAILCGLGCIVARRVLTGEWGVPK